MNISRELLLVIVVLLVMCPTAFASPKEEAIGILGNWQRFLLRKIQRLAILARVMKHFLALMLWGVAFSAGAQVLLTERTQSFCYTYEAVQVAANDAVEREYLEFVKDDTLSKNWRMQARLDALLKPIVGTAQELRPRLGALPWRVLLVRDEAYTVASKPNGQITVSEPYLLEMGFDDAELTFVLAHEVAHVAAEHTRELLSEVPRHYEPNLAISALRAAELLAEVAYMFEDMMPMYRRLDQEADLIGIFLARRLGIPGPRMLSVFDKMARAERGYKMVDDHDAALIRKKILLLALPWIDGKFQVTLVK